MTTVLVTGATGFIGRSVTARLLEERIAVRGAVRDAGRALAFGREIVPCVVGDLRSSLDWSPHLKGVDTVVHLAALVHVFREKASEIARLFHAVNVDATETLARAAAASGVRRLVFLSSVKVYGEGNLHPYSEADPPAPLDAYGWSKLEAERALARVGAESGLEYVVLRSPLVYGIGVKANFRRLLWLAGIARRWPLPLGGIPNRRSLVYLGNVVSALVHCVKDSHAAGRTYLVSDGQDLSTSELIERLAAALGGRQVRLLPCPVGMISQMARLVGRGADASRLFGSLRVDSSAIRTDLGWTPPFTVDEGLRETAAWWRSHSGTRRTA